MATEKKEINFFETLMNFQEGKEIDFNQFLVKRTYGELSIILDGVMLQLEILKTKPVDEVQYEVQKQYIKFFYGLLQCTSLKVVEQDMNIDNVDLDFEQEILNRSATVRKLYKMIDNIIHKQELGVVVELTKQFDSLPTPEQIRELQQDLDNMFQGESEEKLKILESILAYNDPSMKAIKEIISSPALTETNIKKENNGKDSK